MAADASMVKFIYYILVVFFFVFTTTKYTVFLQFKQLEIETPPATIALFKEPAAVAEAIKPPTPIKAVVAPPLVPTSTPASSSLSPLISVVPTDSIQAQINRQGIVRNDNRIAAKKLFEALQGYFKTSLATKSQTPDNLCVDCIRRNCVVFQRTIKQLLGLIDSELKATKACGIIFNLRSDIIRDNNRMAIVKVYSAGLQNLRQYQQKYQQFSDSISQFVTNSCDVSAAQPPTPYSEALMVYDSGQNIELLKAVGTTIGLEHSMNCTGNFNFRMMARFFELIKTAIKSHTVTDADIALMQIKVEDLEMQVLDNFALFKTCQTLAEELLDMKIQKEQNVKYEDVSAKLIAAMEAVDYFTKDLVRDIQTVAQSIPNYETRTYADRIAKLDPDPLPKSGGGGGGGDRNGGSGGGAAGGTGGGSTGSGAGGSSTGSGAGGASGSTGGSDGNNKTTPSSSSKRDQGTYDTNNFYFFRIYNRQY